MCSKSLRRFGSERRAAVQVKRALFLQVRRTWFSQDGGLGRGVLRCRLKQRSNAPEPVWQAPPFYWRPTPNTKLVFCLWVLWEVVMNILSFSFLKSMRPESCSHTRLDRDDAFLYLFIGIRLVVQVVSRSLQLPFHQSDLLSDDCRSYETSAGAFKTISSMWFDALQ